MDLAVVVGTFGDDRWSDLAQERAVPSAGAEGLPVIHHHGDTLETYGASLAACRNRAAEETDAEWLCFLDADDELRPGFHEAMAAAEGDLRTPAVEYVRGGRVRPPIFWPECDLREGNWLIVSTLVRRQMFFDVGAFRDCPMYEDWDLFQRCWKEGAEIRKVPEATVRVHINLASLHRNGSTRLEKREAHDFVTRLNFPELLT